METKTPNTFILYLILALIVLVIDSVASIEGFGEEYYDAASLKRSSFPEDFIFGTSSSAYQYEGAANERGPSIWDTYTKKYPSKIKDQSDGSIAVDSYHRYKEDVQIMKDLGFDAYRFSISWSRLLPGNKTMRQYDTQRHKIAQAEAIKGGNLSSGINRQAIMYYDNLINELLSKGLEPFVTLFHYDHPQSLLDAYGGFLSPQVVKDFTDYAEVCFKAFGDRVKYWITLNGPSIFSQQGYTNGVYAPGRCSNWLPFNCTGGDSATEPYLVSHHLLLAHATVVKVYREKYQRAQRGQIGFVHAVDWVIPLSQSKADIDATSRVNAFKLDWFMEPLNSGSYPIEMIQYVGERLPKFSKEQSDMVKNSFDFIGINYYSTTYVADAECPSEVKKSYLTDFCAELTYERDGIPIGPRAASEWIYLYPQGIEEVLLYVKNKFNNPIMYITENGYSEFNDGKGSLKDNERIDCHNQHLSYVHSAILKGVDVRGYFAWSLLDNFEWSDGYTVRFGIVYVNYTDGLKRYPKDSAKWFKRFLYQEFKSQ